MVGLSVVVKLSAREGQNEGEDFVLKVVFLACFSALTLTFVDFQIFCVVQM